MNNIVNELINAAKPKMFRGKPTNRKMLNIGVKYYDTNEIPYLETIDPLIKQYFNIPDEYDNLFINVYEHNHAIGNHCDKDFGMDTTKDIISISLGINNNDEIITGNVKLGWMKINDNKIDIINNKKIEFDYTTPHEAKTLIKKTNLKYRVNFTFRASKKEVEVEKEEEEVETSELDLIIDDFFQPTFDRIEKPKPTPINDVFSCIDLRELIFGFKKTMLENDRKSYEEKEKNTNKNSITTRYGLLNIGEKFYEKQEIYQVVKSYDMYIEARKVLPLEINLPCISRYQKNKYYYYDKKLDTGLSKNYSKQHICRAFKNQNIEIWRGCYIN